MRPLHPPLRPPGSGLWPPSPHLCQYNLCCVQSATLHNKPCPRPGSLCSEGAEDSASQSESPEGPGACWEPVLVIFLGVRGLDHWTPGLWPQRKPTGEGRAYLPASGVTPMGSAGPRQPLKGGGGVLGPWPVLARAQRHGEGPGAALPGPHPPRPGPGPVFALGSGRWMGCHLRPFFLMAQRTRRPGLPQPRHGPVGASSGSRLGLGVREGVLTGVGG